MNTHKLTPPTSKAKWRTIPGFPNYAVSSEGKFACTKGKGYFLTVCNLGMVRMMADGKRAQRSTSKIFNEVWGGSK